MILIPRVFLLLALVWMPSAALRAQEKSVKPGINDSFRDPDPKEFQGRFEVESREVYARRQEIVAACQIKPGQTVADIGAGTGLFTRMFSTAVGESGRVVAVDISQKFLDHIEVSSREAGLKNIETLLGKGDSTELPAGSIDVAFICDTYHHFEFPLKTMASIQQALKPGGRVIVVDFRRVDGTSREWVLNHVRAGQDVVQSEVIQSGFCKTGEDSELLRENYFIEFTKCRTPSLKPQEFPIISSFGGVTKVASATERVRPGAKLVLDVTADGKPGDVNKGLERAARLVNLYGVAGLKASDVSITIVLHGEATRSVLNDPFYKVRYGVDQNPNLPLIAELRKAAVEVFVCGQALNYKGFPESAVASDVSIADSALTVIVNRQTDGSAYVPVP